MEPIAIVGIGCRFPTASDLRSLWALLRAGREVVQSVPAGRYLELDETNVGEAYVGDPDLRWRLRSLRGGFLAAIDLFDPAAFNISPREARVIDPQQRLLLETTWEALEDAGQDLRRLAGTSVGVYVGVWGSDYQARLFRMSPNIDIAMTTGGGRYAAAGRLSYAFDFQGPSLTIDTACSSSLVAIHMACQALRAGECNLAIAGGANVILDSAVTLGYLSAGALSPDGRCKFGDASADGYVRSEGAGVVVLKPLRSALANNDPIHAIIRGSAVTHNGQTGGSLLAPGEAGQLRLLKQALAAAEIGPSDLDLIEAHGTGTRVGDRMELRALGELLREGRPLSAPPCLIGSIKTNIGHTESAAGIAGLIKAVLCLKHREVPASLHFRQPNPDVPWQDLPLQIVTAQTPLRSGGRPAIAGVNSFGITGTFAHVILEEHLIRENSIGYGATRPHPIASTGAETSGALDHGNPTTPVPMLLPLSARSRGALDELAGEFAKQIRSSPDQLANLAYSAALRRTHHELRLAVVGRDARSLSDALEGFAQGNTTAACCPSPEQPLGEPRLVWVFSGQGPQWPGMGRQLFDTEPAFRAMIERIEPLIEARTGWSLLRELTAPGEYSQLSVTAVAQPAIFAIQVGLAALLESWGLVPTMIVGHSVGEAAAAYVAGVLTLEEAVYVICARAHIAEKAAGLGKMAAVELTVDEARQMIAAWGGRLSLAAVNGPRSLTISGAAEPLQEFCDQVAARSRFCRVLDVNYPFHSVLLDPLLTEMSTIGQGITPREPHTALYSTVYGRLATAADFSADYWPRNLRETVQFAPAIQRMAADGANLFVEISPHPVLTYSIKQVLQSSGAPGRVVESLRRDGDAAADLRQTVGQLYVHGCDPDWSALVPRNGRPVPLPSYPWQRQSYWIDERSPSAASSHGRPSGLGSLDPLLQRLVRAMGGAGNAYWESEISLERFPWLSEHCVQGRCVFPAAAYLLSAQKGAHQLLPEAVLADIELHEALFVPAVASVALQFGFQRATDGTYALTIHAGDSARPDLARQHVSGQVLSCDGSAPPLVLWPATFAENGRPASDRDAVYAAMRQSRLDYGACFQGIELLRQGQGEALARLTLPPAIESEVAAYGIHPATLDAAIQTLVSLTPDWSKSDELWMPRAVREFSLKRLPAAGASLWAWAKVTASPNSIMPSDSAVPSDSIVPGDSSAAEIVGDVFLVDDLGDILVAIRGMTLQRVDRGGDVSQWLHEVRWQPLPLPSELHATETDCLPTLAEIKTRMAAVEPSPAEQRAIRATLADLNRIGGLSVQQAFVDLGFALTPGRRFTLDELIAATGIVPQHRRLLKRLLQILAEDGVISADGNLWQVQRAPDRANLSAQLDAASSVDADFAPLWQIFSRASLNLAAALTGRADAVELLFSGEGAAALEKLYSQAPFWRAATRRLQEAVAAIVERLPANGRLRVLEIGAGTGGLTTHLLPLLPANHTEYVFTDLSSYFLRRAREKFAAYPFLSDKIFDVEREPLSQGFAPASFDLILAANCLHATRSVRQSLVHVRQLLAPGGTLLLQEEMAAERWTDLIFGLTDGWWRFDDNDLRADHPLLSPRSWLEVLDSQGFIEGTVLGGSDQDACGAAVVMARQPATVEAAPNASAQGQWLLLADSTGAAEPLALRLKSLRQNCRVIEPDASDDPAATASAVAKWLAAEDAPGRPVIPDRTVIDLRPLDAVLAETDDTAALERIEERALTGFLGVLRLLADCQLVHRPRLVLVTCGAQATGTEQTRIAPIQAAVWTACRVAGLEHPRLPLVRIDLENTPIDQQIAALSAELLLNDGEPEIALRASGRLVPRLHRLEAPDADQRPLPTDSPFSLEIARRGALDGIEVRPAPQRPPAADEVQIQVRAAGVNFRDVLNVLGAVDRVPLGLECSGIVTAVGAAVDAFAVGDEVLAAGLGSWRSYFNTPASLVARKPARLGFEQATALPIAYLTAHYALRHVASVQRGQRVLIHSAAGGVGLAAVHLALAAGAEVFGTAGSPAKRDYLRSLGVSWVFDSRSLEFADQVRAVCSQGLDVVLNCFTGEFIPKSLELLAHGGHFVEIGKRDIWTNEHMAECRPDVKYQVLELAQVMRSDPAHLQPMLRELASEVASGQLPPLPIRAYPLSHVLFALRTMQQGRHTGKIVLTAPGNPLGRSVNGAPATNIHSWLITGGLGGLGLALVEWLVERGERQLILVSRQSPHDAQLAAIKRLEARGTRILTAKCDVANQQDLAAVLERASQEMAPLRGVFHLAGVLDDGPVTQLDWPRFAKVYGPKVHGAWNLHRLTRDMPLDCFVLFSSWTALLGSPGQANHASACGFLDALAHERRTQGLPAQTINWGGWRDVGSAARPERLAHLARQGMGSFSPAEGLAALDHIMRTDAIQIGVSPFDAAAWRASSPTQWPARFAANLSTETSLSSETSPTSPSATDESSQLSLRESLNQAPSGAARRQLLEGCIRRHLARVLRTSAANFDVVKPFKALGLDSLTSLELRNFLETDTGLKLPASLVYNHVTITTLATELAAQMGVSLQTNVLATTNDMNGTHAGNDASEDELAELLSALEQMPSEEALRLLVSDPAQGGGR